MGHSDATTAAAAPDEAHESRADDPQNKASSGHATLDPRVLSELRSLGRGENILGRIFRSYRANAPQLMDTMREAVEEDDTEALSRAAHSLKSSSGNIGASALVDACRSLEAIGRDGTTKGAAEVLEAARQELELVLSATRDEEEVG